MVRREMLRECTLLIALFKGECVKITSCWIVDDYNFSNQETRDSLRAAPVALQSCVGSVRGLSKGCP